MLRTPLCDLLGIDVPILQAGMARTGASVTPPELVAAVSNAGGLGCVGATVMTPEQIRDQIQLIRKLTDRPFGVDLLVPSDLEGPDLPRDEVRAVIRREFPDHWKLVQSLYEQFGVTSSGGSPEPYAISPTLIRQQVEVILEERVAVFVSALGDPGWAVPEAHALGIKVIGVAGAPRHAARQLRAGVDAIIAQGAEAGGHVGGMATLPLIPQAVDAAGSVPVIAAGGIGDGRGMAAALALGAQGVWCGTAFLFANEANVPDVHRQQLAAARWTDVTISRIYTGKPCRTFDNEFKAAWRKSGLDPLPMQYQQVMMDDFCADAEAAGRHDLSENAAGQIVEMFHESRPAAEIVEAMAAGCLDTLDALARLTAGGRSR